MQNNILMTTLPVEAEYGDNSLLCQTSMADISTSLI